MLVMVKPLGVVQRRQLTDVLLVLCLCINAAAVLWQLSIATRSDIRHTTAMFASDPS
jgi:hypothetical protein